MEYGKELAALLEKVSVESDFFIEDSIKSRLDIILDNSERSKGVHLGNVVDYSPLAPINLNVKITPTVTGYLTNAAATTALKGSVAMAIDAAKEDSMSIIGHDGGIFGHLDFPH